ncbi:unnamed protein product, partial [Symbiodinium necroappetens]
MACAVMLVAVPTVKDPKAGVRPQAGKFGGLALLRSGDVFLERLGITRTYNEAMSRLLCLLMIHLVLAALLLAYCQPRFSRAKCPPWQTK